ncbi:MAG: hypothetical protein FWH26_00005 [Oscillospiraceae bacterium]|nr:hypothetical protein [Oscillospiraceae bacterium]
MEKKKIVTIVVSVGAVILIAAAALIFIGIFANQQPDPVTPTQPPYSNDDWDWQPEETYTVAPAPTAAQTNPPPLAPATQPPAPNNTLPSDAEVMTLFKATSISKTTQGKQLNPDEWLVYLPLNTTITIPADWIANTAPSRWHITGAPAGFRGTDGEILPAGTQLTALISNDELYVRFLR